MKRPFGILLVALALSFAVQAQDAPVEITLALGDSTSFDMEATEGGSVMYRADRSARNSIMVARDGSMVKALKPGSFTVFVFKIDPAGNRTERSELTVNVPYPPLESIMIHADAELYAGSMAPIHTMAMDASGEREGASVEITSSDPGVVTVMPYGQIMAAGPGTATLTASLDGVESTHTVTVVDNPVRDVQIFAVESQARTGDVIQFNGYAYDEAGQAVEDASMTYSTFGKPVEDGKGASAMIDETGRFVAEEPGLYSVTVSTGSNSATTMIEIVPRDVAREMEFLGHGSVSDKHTSDFWIWEGSDGRDYAITGTWGANGEAFFWDVTDPANMVPLDTVTVDARTVNDVKISEDGRIGVIGREGASDRKNGLVILDTSDPANVSIISEFSENLTGGVHNLFIYDNHIYSLSAGQRYDIINIEDPAKPHRVGSFKLDTPNPAIHDVWVVDGIAYSSNWHDGVQLVDVGNGIAGGSPSNPVQFASYAYPSGWNHAAFPYKSESTGKTYVIAGDEAFPNGLNRTDSPSVAAGYLHFIDFTDPENPKEVARYEVPEAGSHNFWVEDDKLYIGYYNAGLRVVDISGDLQGDLYKQSREISHFRPSDPNGFIKNAPFTWGAQPHKGNIFFSDWNSGLWSARMKPEKKEKTAS